MTERGEGPPILRRKGTDTGPVRAAVSERPGHRVYQTPVVGTDNSTDTAHADSSRPRATLLGSHAPLCHGPVCAQTSERAIAEASDFRYRGRATKVKAPIARI